MLAFLLSLVFLDPQLDISQSRCLKWNHQGQSSPPQAKGDSIRLTADFSETRRYYHHILKMK